MYLILIVNIYAIMFSVDNFIPPLQLTHIDCKHQCTDLLKFNQVNCKIALLWNYLHYQAFTKQYASLDQSTCRLHLFYFTLCILEHFATWCVYMEIALTGETKDNFMFRWYLLFILLYFYVLHKWTTNIYEYCLHCTFVITTPLTYTCSLKPYVAPFLYFYMFVQLLSDRLSFFY